MGCHFNIFFPSQYYSWILTINPVWYGLTVSVMDVWSGCDPDPSVALLTLRLQRVC